MIKVAVIIPAAGMSKRFAASVTPESALTRRDNPTQAVSKIELDLRGKAVFLRSLDIFSQRAEVVQTILAVNPDAVDDFKFKWGERLSLQGIDIVPGGKAERWETVLNALSHVRSGATHVAVHDAARPMTTPELVTRVFEAAAHFPAIIPGYAVNATLKRVSAEPVKIGAEADPLDAILGGEGKGPVVSARIVEATVDRSRLVEVQTPQVFEIGLLRRAYAQITDGKIPPGVAITDDAGLVELLGEKVHVVDGEVTNLKITRAEDVKLCEAILNVNEPPAKRAEKMFRNLDDDE